MNNNLEFENEDPCPNSIEDNHPRTNYGEGYGNKKTLEEAAESRYGTDMDSIRGSNVYDLNTDLKRGFIEGAKWQQEQDKKRYSEEDMINFAEFVATYQDKNKNYKGEMLHAKSKYDGAERTIDLLEIWFEQFKKK
jgi:hypothetical protein